MAKARKTVKRTTVKRTKKASARKTSASKGASRKASNASKSSKASKAALHVIIYTTQTCPFCILAKRLLQSKNVAYIERDVMQDKNYAKEMISKSHQMGVPVLDINGHIIIGCDNEAILKAIKR